MVEGPGQGMLTDAGKGMEMDDGGCCSPDSDPGTEPGMEDCGREAGPPGMKGCGGNGGCEAEGCEEEVEGEGRGGAGGGGAWFWDSVRTGGWAAGSWSCWGMGCRGGGWAEGVWCVDRELRGFRAGRGGRLGGF